MKPVPVVVELFCGCGGLSTGLLKAGMQVALGTDVNRAAVRTYEHNHGHVGSTAITADVQDLSGDGLRELAKVGKRRPLILAGGPPCQPFSIVGKRRALDDDRGNLVFEFLRVLRELSPDAFIFENVPNFARIEDGAIAERLVNGFRRAGYAASASVLSAAEYGVPQMRKRYFIVGVRDRRAPGLPPATHGKLGLFAQRPIRTCVDAIDDLPDVGTPEAERHWNHEVTSHSPAMLETFKDLKPGERDPKSHHDRLHPDRPAYTLRAGFGNFSPLRPIHYKYDRVISVRESARIQTFPDSFVWPVGMSRLQQYRQVGNAVPPALAKAIAQHLAAHCSFELDPERFGAEPLREPPPSVGSFEEQVLTRRRLIRGASIGRTAVVEQD
jgi:DNA (cytosine-5)-methyltransferase 1